MSHCSVIGPADPAPRGAWAPLPDRAPRWLRAETGLAETSTPAPPD